jgi:mono/diheme cytochrome c family protein
LRFHWLSLSRTGRHRGAKILLLAGCAPLCACTAPYHPSAWLSHVPPAEHARRDPLPRTAQGMRQAGNAYGLYCASCHGADGAGSRSRPSLRSARVRGESDGDIHWILEQGSRNHGMPAWRSLGDTALWQLVQYVRALPPAQR